MCACCLQSVVNSLAVKSAKQADDLSAADEIGVSDVAGLSSTQLRDRISRRMTVLEVFDCMSLGVSFRECLAVRCVATGAGPF